MIKFTDTEFMSGEEKGEILKDWIGFLESRLQKEKFTRHLYHHLSLHCGFIAHFDEHGFYSAYFQSVLTAAIFFQRLRQNKDLNSDFADLNNAMVKEFDRSGKEATRDLARIDDERFKALQQMIENAKDDPIARSELIHKLF